MGKEWKDGWWILVRKVSTVAVGIQIHSIHTQIKKKKRKLIDEGGGDKHTRV